MTRDHAFPPRVVALDGDDTLWHNETMFVLSQGRFREILGRHVPLTGAEIDEVLLATERANLRTYGYGIKGFMLSMVESAIEVTKGAIPAADIEEILRFGRLMFEHPVELIEGARETIETLRARDHEVWLISKGDLFDQESKIARSGLADLFHRIEIVSEKDEATYRRLLHRQGVGVEEFAMAGNSMRSDVLPVAAIGARAFYIPHELTWIHERAEPEAEGGIVTLRSIAELPRALAGDGAGETG